MRGCGDVAEHCAPPAGEDRREPAPLDAQRGVAEGVDAAVHHVQPTAAHQWSTVAADTPNSTSCARDTTPHWRPPSSATTRDMGG